MPIHEYRCRACGHEFERLVRFSSTPSSEMLACPSCQGQDLEQLLSLFAVSSEGTKQLHRAQGRRLAQGEIREQKHAEIEAVAHHHREHES
jgi:putative FmdB family regulatory protein